MINASDLNLIRMQSQKLFKILLLDKTIVHFPIIKLLYIYCYSLIIIIEGLSIGGLLSCFAVAHLGFTRLFLKFVYLFLHLLYLSLTLFPILDFIRCYFQKVCYFYLILSPQISS